MLSEVVQEDLCLGGFMNSKGKNMKMYIDGRHGKSGGRYYIQAYGTRVRCILTDNLMLGYV